MQNSHYVRLLAMIVLSFFAMYVLMYAMVNEWSNVYASNNQAYMAGLMAASMVPIELGLMWSMYRNRTVNLVVIAVSILALVGFFLLIRQQSAIGNTQFLRSMIPHHSGAILMCERAPITDGEIKKLCVEIIRSQREEIAQMENLLRQGVK